MSYNPFSIDNILANNVPKRCSAKPASIEVAKKVDITSPLIVSCDHDFGFATPKASTPKGSPTRSPASCTSSPGLLQVPSPSSSGSSETEHVSPSVSPVPSAGSEGEGEEHRKKKARTSFSLYQIDQLERKFASQRYLGASERSSLAEMLNLSDHQVKTWFQNRRMKEKRQIREAEERLGHSITSLPPHMTSYSTAMTSLPSHLVMSPGHAFINRSFSEIPPLGFISSHVAGLHSNNLHSGVHTVPSLGRNVYASFPTSVAPSPLVHSSQALRVQVGF